MSYKRLGDLQGGNGPRGSLGDIRQGLEKHKQALGLFLQIADANPADLTKKTLLAASLSSVADDLVKLGDRDQAIDYYKRTLELEKPLAEDTSNPTLRSNLAVDYSRIGDTLVLSGRPEDALNNFREALRLIEPMAKADPKDTNLQAKLVLSRASIGNALVEDGRLAEGQHLLLQSLAEAENLARTAGDSQDRTILAFVEVWTGEAMEKAKDISRALQHYTVALQMYSEISKADPKDLEDAVSVVATYDHLGSAYLKLRNISTAQEQYRKALTVAESLVSSHSENMEVLFTLADTEAGLGDVSAARVWQTESVHDPAQRWMEARDWYRRSLSTWQKIPNPSHISPNGFEVADPREIAHRLAECMAHTSDTERQSWKAR